MVEWSSLIKNIFLMTLCLTAAAKNAAAVEPGKAVFAGAGCKSCHRVGSSGGNSGPDLTFVGIRRSRSWLDLWLENPRAWKKDALMSNPRLSPKAREAIADYLSAQKGQALPEGGRPWERPGLRVEEAGRLIYARAGCVACHGRRGEGGHPNNNVPGGMIPALTKTAGTFTAEELRAKIRRGVKPAKQDPAGTEPMAAMPAWGEVLSEGEIKAVASYVLTLSALERAEDW